MFALAHLARMVALQGERRWCFTHVQIIILTLLTCPLVAGLYFSCDLFKEEGLGTRLAPIRLNLAPTVHKVFLRSIQKLVKLFDKSGKEPFGEAA